MIYGHSGCVRETESGNTRGFRNRPHTHLTQTPPTGLPKTTTAYGLTSTVSALGFRHQFDDFSNESTSPADLVSVFR